MMMTIPTTIRSRAAAAVLATLLALPAGLASASPELRDTVVGRSADEVRATLTEKGYEVRKIETEDGLLEAYAIKDGARYELYVDTATGKVVKVKQD